MKTAAVPLGSTGRLRLVRHNRAESFPGPTAVILGWIAVGLVTVTSGFFGWWGIIEAFHEGWWKPTLGMRLLQLVAYLSPATVLCALTVVGLRWPRSGAALFVLLGLTIAALIIADGASFGLFLTTIITAVPVLVGLLFLVGRPKPKWAAYFVSVATPLLIIIGFGVEPVVRVSTRFDDGNRGAQLVEGNGVTLLWAPAGPGWARNGLVSWDDAVTRARHLYEDGTALADEPQDVWRLPNREEIVRSLTRSGGNAGGTWDPHSERPSYERRPDKESPLWDPYAPLIYLWTSEEQSEDRAWIVVYHGGVFAKPKAVGSPSFGFRAVRDASRKTWKASRVGSTDAVAANAEVFEYGEEQAIVDAMTKESDRQAVQEYPNELDHVLSVLLARAYPKPKQRDLVRSSIDALCGEVERLTHGTISDSQRSAWAEIVGRTKSFESVLRHLEAIAAQGMTREQLVNIGLPALVDSTGSKAATVLSASEAERIMNLLEARGTPSEERGMLGLDISKWPTIKVLPGTPAAEAGLLDGDVVVRINARDVAKTEVAADALTALREAADSAISLTIERAGATFTFDVRKTSGADRVKASVLGSGIVYVQIPLFEAVGVAKRVNELIHRHVTDATSSVILDLRDNVGGRAEEANAVADIFLDEKYLQIFQFRDGRRIAFKSKPGAMETEVIVLTNHNTESAAEMLAIALHDNKRATVIGQHTAGVLFGKDFEKLGDDRMIVFRSEPTVLSPTGKDYSKAGLPPDIMVDESNAADEDKILARAIHLARSREP